MENLQKSCKEFVVFDFDQTVVSIDTAVTFHEWLIRRSAWRSCVMLPVFPVMKVLRQFEKTQRWGLNLGCFVATLFQCDRLSDLRGEFLENHFLNRSPVYPQALAAMTAHKSQGREVVVISGCPLWLLTAVIDLLALPVDRVIASESQPGMRAMLLSDLCYGHDKIRFARANGLDMSDCHSCYSDSLSDIPILASSRNPYFVNLPKRHESRLPDSLADRVEILEWSLAG